ncbi:MAG: hypothetical protein ABI688_02945 [Bacteroidota bacterium]
MKQKTFPIRLFLLPLALLLAGVVSSQIATVALPKFKIGAADYFNFNPGINFTATAQKIGNITVPTLSHTS